MVDRNRTCRHFHISNTLAFPAEMEKQHQPFGGGNDYLCSYMCSPFSAHTSWTSVLTFFIFPYPNTRGLWVNFNSPLVWDVFAISTYFTISLVFWYVGLIPDIGTLRDKIGKGLKKTIYTFLSFGWKGSARDWHRHEVSSIMLAAIATPLVLSVHSLSLIHI